MVAPKKLSTKSRDERTAIAKTIIKVINKSTKEQPADKPTEVKVEVIQVGHGHRPFGTHFPNDYIDFSIKVGDGEYKVEGLGTQDISAVGKELESALAGKYDIENADLFFSYGNFTPDMVFPTYYRKFPKPCKEFKELVKVASKKGIELKVDTLYRLSYGKKYFTAYYPALCNMYIEDLKSKVWKDAKWEASPDERGDVEIRHTWR